MKRLFFTLCITTIIISCTQESSMEGLSLDNSSQSDESNSLYEHSPEGDVQRIELASGQVVYMDSDSTYFLADVTFSREQIEQMNSVNSRSVAVKSIDRYWQNKVIPYTISSGFTQYSLPSTEYILQEDMGVLRHYYNEWYTVYVL